MDSQPSLDWKTVHEQACTIVDLHAHPSLNVSLFNRAITKRVYPSTRAFDPFSVRTNVHQLQQGSVDVLLSVIYPPGAGHRRRVQLRAAAQIPHAAHLEEDLRAALLRGNQPAAG